MSWQACVLWGPVGAVLMTALLASAQTLGLTRISLTYLLGTMLTPERDRAQLAGTLMHLLIGVLFALLYVAAFHAWGAAGWWRGALLGAVHATFVLTAGMAAIPALHPRMASEQEGPDRVPLLEPPGMFALNYGVEAPVALFAAHLLFGVVLGVAFASA